MRRLLVSLAIAGILPGAALAQTYSIDWWTVDAGGARSSGGGYTLGQTSGQPDAGALTGGSYALTGGFWNASSGALVDVPEPLVESPPTAFRMLPSRPNPFQDRTRFAIDLPEERAIRIEVYNLSGQRVRTLLDGMRPAGRHQVFWDGADDGGQRLPAGIYFVSVRAGQSTARSKVVLIE